MHTSEQTSVGKVAVKSHTSLCRSDGKSPFGQECTCFTRRLVPQAQFDDGRQESGQSYLKETASKKAPLCRQKPCSPIGNAVSQLDAPFSRARSTVLSNDSERMFFYLCKGICKILLPECYLRLVRQLVRPDFVRVDS